MDKFDAAPHPSASRNARRPPSPTRAGLSGESGSTMQTSLCAQRCNPRWVRLALLRRSHSPNLRFGEVNCLAKLRICNLRESSQAIFTTEKLSPDTPALGGE